MKELKLGISTSFVVMLSLTIAGNQLQAQEILKETVKKKNFLAVLPTVYVEIMKEDDTTKGYVNYEDASLSRSNLTIKEIPKTINTLNVQKNKNYGANDLSSILEGVAGIDTTYDMRSDNIFIRGFRADTNDIYRDGIRESGQIRRSTANVERVEILKGPASLLYGRSTGGGIINMVSKYANFSDSATVGLLYGSWNNQGINLDVNKVATDKVAFRFVTDITEGGTFREGIQKSIENKSKMFSPSVVVNINDNIKWTGQYTYDYAKRTPDRGPTKAEYDKMGISYDKAFAHDGDYVEDELQILRSSLDMELNEDWNLNWALAYRQAEQNFDHYYAGTYDTTTKTLSQGYAWQKTDNKTLSNNLTLNGEFEIANILNRITIGLDYSKENRNPTLYYTNGQNFDPFDSSSWTRIDQQAAKIKNEHKGTSSGIFIEDVIEITPQLNLVIGGRFDKYKFKSKDINDNNSSYSSTSFSPSLGLVYNINYEHTVYSSYNKSFSPYGGSGYLGISASTDSSEFNTDPSYNQQYEIGVKSDWLDGRLSSTISAYQIEHYNIRYQPDDTDPTLWAVRREEKSKGAELSLIGQVFKDVYIRSSIGIMDAKVTKDKENPENEGHKLSNTAKINGNIFARYTPISSKFYTELGVTHIGKRYYYSRSGVESTLSSFNKVDGLVGMKYKKVNVTLGISNLLNKEYWRSSAMPGASRYATLRMNYKF